MVLTPIITSLGTGGMTEQGAQSIFAPLSPLPKLEAPSVSLSGHILTVEAPEEAEEIAIYSDGALVGVYPVG